MPNRLPGNLLFAICATITIALLAMPVMARALFDFLNDGSAWRQGDWLINLGEGFVRRGLFGEVFIALSDVTGLQLLVVVQLFQILLFVALTFLVWLICLTTDRARILIMLAASPAFFLIFWAGDSQGTMRKEMFGLLAIALVAISAQRVRPPPGLLAGAVVLYTLGCIGNILHIFMAPPLMAGIFLLAQAGRISMRRAGMYIIATLVMSVLWLGIATVFKEAPAIDGLCMPLVQRGLDPSFCGGAIYWIVEGNIDHGAALTKLMTPQHLGRFGVVAVLSLLSVALTFHVFHERRILAILLLLAFLPMLPLYVIATDWGRWLSLSYTAYAFLVFQALTLGLIRVQNRPHTGVLAGLFIAALLLSHEHGVDWKPGGALHAIGVTVTELR